MRVTVCKGGEGGPEGVDIGEGGRGEGGGGGVVGGGSVRVQCCVG